MRNFRLPIIFVIGYAFLFLFRTDMGRAALLNASSYFMEMLLIMPPVFILMGLFAVWVPGEAIKKYLGKKSGLKGMILAFFLGTLPTGPLYAAFPVARGLYFKGISVLNLIIFLNTWAALKIPQLLVEVRFLGVSFTLMRFLLTVIFTVIMGIIIEKLNPEIPGYHS